MIKSNTYASTTKLFVAGIPSVISPKKIEEYFCQYGSVNLAFDDPYGNDNHQDESKGHCILICYDRKVAERITKIRFFKFMDRTLTVSKHISGVGLIIQTKRINQYRVIFKKVPNWFTEEEFTNEIEEQCGPVQAIFRYKPPHIEPTNRLQQNIQKYHTYSVILQDRNMVKELISSGQLWLSDGSAILTEKYAKAPLGNRTHKSNFQQTDHHLASSSFRRTEVSNVQTKPLKNPNKSSELPTNSSGELCMHMGKPTSKVYHSENRHFGNGKSIEIVGRLRFNILGLFDNHQLNLHR